MKIFHLSRTCLEFLVGILKPGQILPIKDVNLLKHKSYQTIPFHLAQFSVQINGMVYIRFRPFFLAYKNV